MKLLRSWFVIFLLGMVLVPVLRADEDSCGPQGCAGAKSADLGIFVDELSYDDLMTLKNSEEKFILLDTRGAEQFAAGHIDGALSFPLANMLPEKCKLLLPQDVKIVVYCQSSSCNVSHAAAQKLKSLGYEDVLDYHGGINEWVTKGNQLVKN